MSTETKEISPELPGKKLARQHAEFMKKNHEQFKKAFTTAFMALVPTIETQLADVIVYACDVSIECNITFKRTIENSEILKWVGPAMKFPENRTAIEAVCKELSGFKLRIERAECIMQKDADHNISQSENVAVHFTVYL